MEKNLLRKPNQAIMITNGNITALQRKAYNAILYKAQSILNKDSTVNLFEFTISEIKELAGIKATDNWHVKKDLDILKRVEVDIVRDKNNWDMFNLISWVGRENEKLVIQLPEPIRRELISCNFYTTLNQLIIKTLTGKYAIILYEIAIRYKKIQIPEMTIEELRKLTGTENKNSYDNFARFNIKVLKPAIKEINEKTDIELNYIPKKDGKKFISVKFNLKIKNNENNFFMPKLNDLNQINVFIHEMQLQIKNKLGIDISLSELNNLVENHGEKIVNTCIDNLYKTMSLSEPKDKILNYFKRSVIDTWNFEKTSKTPKIPQHNFDQRTYTESEYEQFYSNSKKAD